MAAVYIYILIPLVAAALQAAGPPAWKVAQRTQSPKHSGVVRANARPTTRRGQSWRPAS